MKLIFVNRYFYPDHSATSQLLSDLAFHLAGQRGRKVCVVTSRQRYDSRGARLRAHEWIAGVDVHRVWTTRFGRATLPGRSLDYASFYLSAAFVLWRLSRRGDLIIAKTDPPLISAVAAAVARLRGAKLVNWVQDAFPEVALALGVRIPFRRALKRVRNWSLNVAEANVLLGDRMADWVRGEGIPSAKLAVIPNWADGDEIRPVSRGLNALRREWGLADKFVVAYSGNLGRAHEYGTVLEAAERLRDEANVVFLFIGGGHLHGALEAERKARGLDNIRCLAYQPRQRLGESLGVADVHWISLLPRLEGLIVPSKIYGALAAGRPTLMIGDRDGEIARLLRRNRCGVTVAVGAGAELAAEILRLRGDPAACDAMGRRARAAFDEHYAPVHAFNSWKRLLGGLQAVPAGRIKP